MEHPVTLRIVRPVVDMEASTKKIVGIDPGNRRSFGSAGFYEFYQIDSEHEDDDSEESESSERGESRGRTVGLHSPWGTIWSICETTGWTVDYVLWGIAWINIRMMLADAPRYISAKKNEKTKEITTSEELDAFLGL